MTLRSPPPSGGFGRHLGSVHTATEQPETMSSKTLESGEDARNGVDDNGTLSAGSTRSFRGEMGCLDRAWKERDQGRV